jgi:CheY-like chemotaxis protein
VIAVTANAMDHHRAEYLAAGMDALVSKPISLASLLQTMDTVLDAAEAEDMSAVA